VADPKRLVAATYDRIAEAYLRTFGASEAKARWGGELIARLPPGGRVLDLGCGAGAPLAVRLVEHGFDVMGVDASARQVELARRNAPQAEFVQAEMTSLALPARGFDGVAAFFSLNHLPRDDLAPLLARVRRWLRPGGVLVANFGVGDHPAWQGEWLGAETFFSSFDVPTTVELVRTAGFDLERAVVERAQDEDAEFLWVIARAAS